MKEGALKEGVIAGSNQPLGESHRIDIQRTQVCQILFVADFYGAGDTLQWNRIHELTHQHCLAAVAMKYLGGSDVVAPAFSVAPPENFLIAGFFDEIQFIEEYLLH